MVRRMQQSKRNADMLSKPGKRNNVSIKYLVLNSHKGLNIRDVPKIVEQTVESVWLIICRNFTNL